ncbi:MAG: hypothetical protein DWQ07_10550 [Chloroflexi bacterium]|nr:MAG: hypothetical protein DWQ07_10550 [Chloroflexota bacterium]MBL1192848.1 hypothetical protein [Chloroflexota bacterium]NOH10141.1 hypothetical protein [Chloroflexota bacterium]
MVETTEEIIETEKPTKNNNTKLFLLIGAVVVILLCACMLCGVFLLGSGIFRVGQEREPVMQVLDKFMVLMEAKDIDAAYDLFSTRAQGNFPFAELENMGTDANVVLFDGYQSLEILSFNIIQSANTNKALPQGTVANVNGIVTYANGIQGSITATLEKEDNVWRLHAINITAPPEKFEDYYENNPPEENS